MCGRGESTGHETCEQKRRIEQEDEDALAAEIVLKSCNPQDQEHKQRTGETGESIVEHGPPRDVLHGAGSVGCRSMKRFIAAEACDLREPNAPTERQYW